MHGRLPIPSIEQLWGNGRNIDAVEAAHVDVDLVWIGTRHVKWINTTMLAERVLCGLGIELVSCQIVLAADQLKLFRCWPMRLLRSFDVLPQVHTASTARGFVEQEGFVD